MASDLNYRQPFAGSYPITQKYGDTITSDFHTGIDYGCPAGTPILASEAGTVVFAGWDSTGYGLCVIIQHKDGNSTLYAHLSSVTASLGQQIKRGQLIGYSGSSGNSTGPHLHFEARHVWNDYKSHFDPMTLPLHTSIDPAIPAKPASKNLIGADAFHKGEIVEVTAPLGAKGFTSDNFSTYIGYPKGSVLCYSGKTEQHNGYTYMECYPLSRPVWIAVNDGDTQILDEKK